MSASSHTGISSIFPIAIFVQGNDQQTLSLNHTPYTVGRKVDRDLVIADPRVSREHASIVAENGEFCVVDLARKRDPIGVLDEIVVTLLEATLKLTRAERGYIFLRDLDGSLTLAAGRNSK